MVDSIHIDCSACEALGTAPHIQELEPAILRARDLVCQDVKLMTSGMAIPIEQRPLDSGFIDLPSQLLQDESGDGDVSLLAQIDEASSMLSQQVDRLVVLGIGGSYMGARALFEALCHPCHNDLSRKDRRQRPRILFSGHNVDNDVMRGTLDLLCGNAPDPEDFERRWAVLVISKSGGTLETAVSFRLFRQALEAFYQPDSPWSRELVIPITGATGKLKALAMASEYPRVFDIPEGIGGRFSVLTSVGLLPAAAMGLDVRRLLAGAADMTRRFRDQPPGDNPVLDYTAMCHVMESQFGKTTRVLSTWGSRLEALGLWYDQLLSESLGKQQRGATPITVVNTRDLHSRGQQHQEGTTDKLITNLVVQQPTTAPLAIPTVDRDQDLLNRLSGKTIPDILDAALQGTNQAYAQDERPTLDIVLPQLDEYVCGQLLQMLMLCTVLEGRLIDINPYGQP
ncbi:MAG: glucose-6-phosphate isomerase, partial [Planctomycetaceae bacterium]